MDTNTCANILFAETGGWAVEPTNTTGLDLARKRMALAVWASGDGSGFALPLAPSVNDLVDPMVLAARQACTAAAQQTQGSAPVPPGAAVLFVAGSDPSQDAGSLARYPWLAGAAPAAAIGQFRLGQGGPRQALYLFAPAPGGAQPGRYPRDATPVMTAAGQLLSGNTGKAGVAGLLFLVLTALLVAACCGAYHVGLHAAALSPAKPTKTPTTVSLVGWWALAATALVLILVLIGYAARRSGVGVLINAQNRLSLSRTQLAGWSVIILSAFAVSSTFLLGAAPSAGLPMYSYSVWGLLGITFGSPILSGIILNQKQGQQPTADARAATDADPTATNNGVLVANLSQNGWSFMDLFTGEELANQDQVDISRFQQFVITVILMIIFIGGFIKILSTIGLTPVNWAVSWRLNCAPVLDSTFLGLLGLSHGGYLIAKALPKTPTDN